LSGFRKFLVRGNVVDLAVAVVIGAAFTAIVTAFVADFLTPLIAAIGGRAQFRSRYFTLHGQKFLYGDFVNHVISFAIVAGVVYFLVVVPVGRLMDRFKPTPAEPTPTRNCPECLSSIPAAARRCAFCGSPQPDAVTT
jgi:large conductance mechanosensitive channel